MLLLVQVYFDFSLNSWRQRDAKLAPSALSTKSAARVDDSGCLTAWLQRNRDRSIFRWCSSPLHCEQCSVLCLFTPEFRRFSLPEQPRWAGAALLLRGWLMATEFEESLP
jgi:hypothetical protein